MEDLRFKDVKMKKTKKGLYIFFLLIMVNFCYASKLGMPSTQTTTLQAKNHLNLLNKTPVKSIHSPDGDIIDCVHVSNQPAFDHPFLKNHTIQMRPSYHPEGLVSNDIKVSKSKGNGDTKPIIQLWHSKGKCPKGTIPIRRTTEEDILRASSTESFGKKKQNSIPIPKPISVDLDQNAQLVHEHAIAFVDGDKFYGAKATISVWGPQVQQSPEFSLSEIWVLAGSFGKDINSIEAGWQVSPLLYGDKKTRLFIYWTNDNYQSTGCYNLLCSGFIQINHEIAIGASLSPLSTYDGSQYEINILIWKDPKDGNWWLQFGNKIIVGYWPASLFTHLADSASIIEWGGEAINSESDGLHTTTQMGSGHFAEEGFKKSSYFKNLQIVDGTNTYRDPNNLRVSAEKSNCYNINLAKSDLWGNYFFYGGPGRNPNCP